MAQDQSIEIKQVEYTEVVGANRKVFIRVDRGNEGGQVEVPYLTATPLPADATDPGHDRILSLTLDNRFGLDLPNALSRDQQDEIVRFIANAIAIGGGYPSIYYTDRKMPFRG